MCFCLQNAKTYKPIRSSFVRLDFHLVFNWILCWPCVISIRSELPFSCFKLFQLWMVINWLTAKMCPRKFVRNLLHIFIFVKLFATVNLISVKLLFLEKFKIVKYSDHLTFHMQSVLSCFDAREKCNHSHRNTRLDVGNRYLYGSRDQFKYLYDDGKYVAVMRSDFRKATVHHHCHRLTDFAETIYPWEK